MRNKPNGKNSDDLPKLLVDRDRAIGRFFLNIASVLSLLLLVVTGVLWVYTALSGSHLHTSYRWEERKGKDHFVIGISAREAQRIVDRRELVLDISMYGFGEDGFFHGKWQYAYDGASTDLSRIRQTMYDNFGPPGTTGGGWGKNVSWLPPRWVNASLATHYETNGYRFSRVAIMASLLPICWLFLRVRRQMRAKREMLEGHCRSCGYNLAGNVSGICPECGSTITTQ
jgi:hypothetical protein